MKNITYRALIGIILALLFVNVGAITQGAPRFIYVFSESMEPTINVNDGFLVWPSFNYEVNDIVVFRPVKLEANLITHRIVGSNRDGFITKGDNSPVTDQASGEPALKGNRILGRVFTINGKPLIIPGLGNIYESMQKKLGSDVRYFAIGLITLGVMLAVWEAWSPQRKKRSRRRWRLRDIYRLAAIGAIGFVVLGVLLGTRVHQVKYLVSVNPGTLAEHMRVDETGYLPVKVNNVGFLPTWHISSAIAPLTVKDAPAVIKARSEGLIIISIPPHQETGWYQGYVRVYNYPMILPRPVIVWLHEQSPYLALAGISVSFALLILLILRVINGIPGVEGWIPLIALKDKINTRRMQKIYSRLFGRRRSRE